MFYANPYPNWWKIKWFRSVSKSQHFKFSNNENYWFHEMTLVFFKLQAFFPMKNKIPKFQLEVVTVILQAFKNLEKTSTPYFGFLFLNLFLGLFFNHLTTKKVLVPQVMCLASKIAFFFFFALVQKILRLMKTIYDMKC